MTKNNVLNSNFRTGFADVGCSDCCIAHSLNFGESTRIVRNATDLSVDDKSLATREAPNDKFLQWFVGFSDGEGSFIIAKNKNLNSDKLRFSFRFQLGLHIDDIMVLEYIQKKLNLGTITKNAAGDECRFVVSSMEDIEKLIAVFDKYTLNTTKYLDYLA